MRMRESRDKEGPAGDWDDSDFRRVDGSETDQPHVNVLLALEKGPGAWGWG